MVGMDSSQYCCIPVAFSEWQDVMSAMPLGSMVGPQPFTIYINYMDEGIYRLHEDSNVNCDKIQK